MKKALDRIEGIKFFCLGAQAASSHSNMTYVFDLILENLTSLKSELPKERVHYTEEFKSPEKNNSIMDAFEETDARDKELSERRERFESEIEEHLIKNAVMNELRLREIPIKDSPFFSTRTSSLLLNNKIKTAWDLFAWRKSELIKLKGFGANALYQVNQYLESIDCQLASE